MARIAVACALASCAAPALAEDDLFDLPIESLMRIQVSVASPFGESVMDSASSVSVLRPDDWQKRGARSLDEAIEQVPSVVPYTSLGGASMFAVRGYANDLSNRGTATLLDGIPVNNYSYATAVYGLPFVPLSLLDRVEMIRGPGSTLYGSDAFHGVISLSTWQPPGNRHQVGAAVGTHDDGTLVVKISEGLASTLRISGGVALTHHGDRNAPYDYVDAATGVPGRGERDNHEEDGTAILNLESGNVQDGRWRLGLYGDKYESDGFPGIGTQFYTPLATTMQTSSLDFGGARDRMGQASDFLMAHAQYERALGNGYSVDVRVFDWRGAQAWALDNSDLPVSVTTQSNLVLPCRSGFSQTGVSPLWCPHTLYQGTTDRRDGIHALLRQALTGNTQWAIGAGRDWLEVLDAPLRMVATDNTVFFDTEAPFNGASRHIDHALLQARTDLQPFSLVYGVRWDDYSDFGSATSPRLGILYKPDGDWSSKLLYSHAFRAPTAGEQYGTGALQLPGINLKPETIDTVELVWQYQRDGHDTELVFFRSRWTDGIALVPVGLGVNRYQNTDKNLATGVELVHRRSFRDWRFEGNLSWTRSENESAEIDYVAFPRWIANLGVGRDLGASWTLWLNERALLAMSEGDAIGMQAPPQAPDYYRTDLHLGYSRGGHESGAYRWGFDIRNLLNRANTMPALFNASGGLPDEERSLQITLELSL